MIDPELMTAERYDSLCKTAGVDFKDLKVCVIDGPTIIKTRYGHTLFVDNDHYEHFMEIWNERFKK